MSVRRLEQTIIDHSLKHHPKRGFPKSDLPQSGIPQRRPRVLGEPMRR